MKVLLLMVPVWLLAACSSVRVAPPGGLPRALVQPMKAHVGLVLDDELRHFKHEETRASADWSVDLGPGHEQLLKAVFGKPNPKTPFVLNQIDENTRP